MSSSDDDLYEVDKVLDKRKRGRVVEYLVHWKGYSNKHNSWEPVSNLSGCREIIHQYNTEVQKRENGRRRSLPVKQQFYSRPYNNRSIRSTRLSPLHQIHSTRHRISRQNIDQSPSSSTKNYVERVLIRRLPNNDTKTKMLSTPSYSLSSTRSFVNLHKRNLMQPSQASTSARSAISYKVAAHSSQPQKIFTVKGNNHIVKTLLKIQNGSQSLPAVRDHDYIYPSSSYRQLTPKQPLNYQGPAKDEETSTSATRKSTLRKCKVFQERLVLLQWRENFVEIIFANTSQKNALTPRFLMEISNALDAVVASKCAVVVMHTVGDVFCSGLDTTFLAQTLSESKHSSDTAKYLAETLRNFVDKLIDFERMLVAIVQGPAIALGCAMLALFDSVYCSDKAWFWTPYIEMGQTPDGCSSVLFPEIMGPATANNMLLNGSRLTAREAKHRGFVTEVYPHDTLKQNAMAVVKRNAIKSVEAIQISKSLIRSTNIHRLKHVNYCECSELAERWSSQDSVTNLTKFISMRQDP